MPLVDKNWKSYGLQDWKVVEFEAGADGKKPYSVGAVLTWADDAGLKKALASEHGKTVLGDVPNFSNKDPVFLIGDVVGASS
jgi:uncharacterized protein (TIGR02118 family)